VESIEAADRVLVMLNTLMDISEAESGAMQLRREAVLLSDVVERAVDLYRDVAETKGVTLTTSVPSAGDRPSAEERSVVVHADRTRLEQVAANLLDNAIKYTPAGGRVDVETRRDGSEALL